MTFRILAVILGKIIKNLIGKKSFKFFKYEKG